MIELFIDPFLNHILDLTKITDHVTLVECPRSDFNLGNSIVAVWVLAETIVIQQTVAVAKVNSFSNLVHMQSLRVA